MAKRRFELIDAKSCKFWEIQIKGSTQIVRYGRLETEGRTVEKEFDSRAEAKASHDKLIKQKMSKGYSEVGSSGAKKTKKVAKSAATKKKITKKKTSKKAAKPVASLRWPKGHGHYPPRKKFYFFPPVLGYSTLHADAYGSGDETGYYWPIGQEKRMPIVVRMFHDSGELAPLFSTRQRYDRWGRAQEDEGEGLPYCAEPKFDSDAPETLYTQGQELIKAKDIPAAIETLERCLVRLPEFTLVSSLLAKIYRREKQLDKAKEHALKSLISPHMFGPFDQTLLKWLGRQSSPPEAYAENPLWTNRKKLKWDFTEKKNDFEIMREAIDAFFDVGQPVLGLTLMQAYAEFIAMEREATQKRLKYNGYNWVQLQDEMCMKHLKVSRRPVVNRSDC